jgi:hypothetical protein
MGQVGAAPLFKMGKLDSAMHIDVRPYKKKHLGIGIRLILLEPGKYSLLKGIERVAKEIHVYPGFQRGLSLLFMRPIFLRKILVANRFPHFEMTVFNALWSIPRVATALTVMLTITLTVITAPLLQLSRRSQKTSLVADPVLQP